MSDDRKRIDPITAEQLLRDARSRSSVDAEHLAGLLGAAAAPTRPAELVGEEATVMAFRNARLAGAPEPRRRFMLKSVPAKLALVKAAVVLAAVGGGGVALAAGSGHLPGAGPPSQHAAAGSSSRATASPHPSSSAGASAHASSSATASAHRTTASHHATPNGSPSPNLRGLCTAFQAHAGDNPGKALDNPAFTALINKAGGKDKVPAYCATLLATPAGKIPTHRGDASTYPTSHPTGQPSMHPSHPKRSPGRHTHPAPSPTHTH